MTTSNNQFKEGNEKPLIEKTTKTDKGSECKEESPKPNPCLEQKERNDCGCHQPKGTTINTAKKPKSNKRGNECLDQIIEMLRCIPGVCTDKPHKPKQRIPRKIEGLCDHLGLQEALLPVLAVLWQRFLAGETARNEFESKIMSIFGTLPEKQQEAMTVGFEGYSSLRAKGRGDCLFDDCLAEVIEKEALEKEWFADILVKEGLKFAGQVFYSGSNGVMGSGKIRLWDNTVSRGPNGTGATIYQGPWPWLTAICPDVSNYNEYGNTVSFRPVPGGQHIWQNHQYAQECHYQNNNGSLTATCERQHPAPPPPGSFGVPCEGGYDYTKGNDCIKIPSQRPGGSIKLRGFNFITSSVKVRFTHTTDSSVLFEQECVVFGDQQTPIKDESQHTIVDERVSDWVDVSIPSSHPGQPGVGLPPGIYAITIIVDNVTNVIYDSATPATLISNRLLIRIEPDPNVRFLLWSDRGRCIDETPGWGSDEIWWDAFVGHFVPDIVPATGTSSVTLNVERKSFPRGPWDDMDSGESAGSYSRDIFGPKAFELYGVAVVAIVGYEVDSESAAREQLENFGEAFAYALKEIATVAIGGEALITSILKIAAGVSLSITLIVLGVVAALVLIGVCFWAAWAPADLIALDLFALDAISAWENTDPKKILPAEQKLQIGEVDISVRPSQKIYTAGDAAATWVAEHQYETPDGEESNYVLEFKLARN